MLASPAWRRAAPVALVFAVCAGIYAATLGARASGTSDNAHYVYLAESYLHGQLHLVGNKPPGRNDWAHYDGRWYVSFPPLPAVVIAPAVAIWGVKTWDRLFWAVLAGLGPAMLFLLLRGLRESGRSERSARDDLWLVALFAFGTAYYYTSVQGTVWFAAHVVAVPLVALFVHFALGARRPLLAGLCLGLCFLARPSTLLLSLFFGLEAIAAARTKGASDAGDDDAKPLARAWAHVRDADVSVWLPLCLRFSIPIVAVLAIAMVLNHARFDDVFVFGHEYLKIRWRKRIDTWGLFNYHYLGRNLAVFLAALPWLSGSSPFFKIGRHGLAIWFTTPNLLWLPWPRRTSSTTIALTVAAVAVALMDLLYQNSGWVQFAYRFSLDYMVLLIVLLALGARRFGLGFKSLAVFAIAVNLFGAITFDRVPMFYDRDPTQRVIFQPH